MATLYVLTTEKISLTAILGEGHSTFTEGTAEAYRG